MGKEQEQLFAVTEQSFNIDHHISNESWADINYIVSDACASAEIAVDVLEELGVTIDKQMADLLYAGIMDDTGSFRYANTNVSALEHAAKLVACGAKPDEVANKLYFSVSEKVLKLRALALSKMSLELAGRVSFLAVTSEMLESLGCSSQDTEGLVDEIRTINGVTGVIFIRELEEKDKWKVSLRSKQGDFDVQAVAASFEGGGHKMAAGCTMEGSLEKVKKMVLEKVGECLP